MSKHHSESNPLSDEEKKRLDELLGETLVNPATEIARDILRSDEDLLDLVEGERLVQISRRALQNPDYARRLLKLSRGRE